MGASSKNTWRLHGDAQWFVDKIPNNFLHIGLIHASRLAGCCMFNTKPWWRTPRFRCATGAEQVRQPISRQGIGSWRRFEAHLEPIGQALGLALAGQAA